MDLIFQEQVFTFSNDPFAVGQLFKCLDQLLSENDMYLKFLVVDGIEVNDDFYDSILEKINKISKVEAVIMTRKQFLDELLLTTQQYIERSIPAIQDLVNEFYGGQTSETWNSFDELLEGLQWVMEFVRTINQNTNLFKWWIAEENINFDFNNATKNLFQAVENRDSVSIADILQYEIIPLLNTIFEKVNTTVHNEVVKNDFT